MYASLHCSISHAASLSSPEFVTSTDKTLFQRFCGCRVTSCVRDPQLQNHRLVLHVLWLTLEPLLWLRTTVARFPSQVSSLLNCLTASQMWIMGTYAYGKVRDTQHYHNFQFVRGIAGRPIANHTNTQQRAQVTVLPRTFCWDERVSVRSSQPVCVSSPQLCWQSCGEKARIRRSCFMTSNCRGVSLLFRFAGCQVVGSKYRCVIPCVAVPGRRIFVCPWSYNAHRTCQNISRAVLFYHEIVMLLGCFATNIRIPARI